LKGVVKEKEEENLTLSLKLSESWEGSKVFLSRRCSAWMVPYFRSQIVISLEEALMPTYATKEGCTKAHAKPLFPKRFVFFCCQRKPQGVEKS